MTPKTKLSRPSFVVRSILKNRKKAHFGIHAKYENWAINALSGEDASVAQQQCTKLSPHRRRQLKHSHTQKEKKHVVRTRQDRLEISNIRSSSLIGLYIAITPDPLIEIHQIHRAHDAKYLRILGHQYHVTNPTSDENGNTEARMQTWFEQRSSVNVAAQGLLDAPTCRLESSKIGPDPCSQLPREPAHQVGMKSFWILQIIRLQYN